MEYDPQEHDRHSIRLRGFDYSKPRMYFITVCATDRRCLFGKLVGTGMVLSPLGKIIDSTWHEIPSHYPGVQSDRFVIMPNHFHGIVILKSRSPEEGRDGYLSDLSLPSLVKRLKSLVYTRYRKLTGEKRSLWQRNYYEHIVRDNDSLLMVRSYIDNDPRRWQMDSENPNRTEEDAFDVWLRTPHQEQA